ncbi:hypothetical protein KIH87_08930 [Paraneptunicella aestuarii]|uniref:hypothetical protein n=1 Tax=Paraneptunicella aestuarii TaxID=2831148 RepID=UPI001E2EC917|nr:hypothetical protein [Paraneptunicella aestuarii]UAA40439.1 hypothetical protein KIH87_08930 [Paraneptunicella aestuarii]
MPFKSPSWSHKSTPHTDLSAKVYKSEHVEGVTVIEVEGAEYRNSKPFEGCFEMVSPNRDPRIWKNSLRAEVYCDWHGVKPPTCWPNIKLKEGKFRIIEKFTGTVIRGLK